VSLFPPWIVAATAAAFDRAFPTDIRCAICGDDSEPAECPDAHGWEDHGLCCMGNCPACQHRIDQGEDL
jgi:hypothetical protein